jgi:transposase
VAVARKLAVLCWHVLTKEQDYLWARPALVANKMRAMELQAGLPQKKGNQRGPAYAYNVKALRDQEMELAEQAERNYARFVDRWRTRPSKGEARERLNPARNEQDFRRRLQPTRRASPRGRSRTRQIARRQRNRLSIYISSVV